MASKRRNELEENRDRANKAIANGWLQEGFSSLRDNLCYVRVKLQAEPAEEDVCILRNVVKTLGASKIMQVVNKYVEDARDLSEYHDLEWEEKALFCSQTNSAVSFIITLRELGESVTMDQEHIDWIEKFLEKDKYNTQLERHFSKNIALYVSTRELMEYL